MLLETNKKVPKDDFNNSEVNNQTNEANELDEHNYIRTSKPSCSGNTNSITELQAMFKLRNKEFDQR